MSCELKKTTLIPCEPFEARVYDVDTDRIIKCRVTGYHVAIREMATFQSPGLLTPIETCDGARHGIIAVPAFEEIPEPILTEVMQ